jgi:hypothetical protein
MLISSEESSVTVVRARLALRLVGDEPGADSGGPCTGGREHMHQRPAVAYEGAVPHGLHHGRAMMTAGADGPLGGRRRQVTSRGTLCQDCGVILRARGAPRACLPWSPAAPPPVQHPRVCVCPPTTCLSPPARPRAVRTFSAGGGPRSVKGLHTSDNPVFMGS